MKQKLISAALIFGFEIFFGSRMLAQGIQMVSNLDQPTWRSTTVASDRWLSSQFWIGDNPGGYRIESVSILMAESGGNLEELNVSIYERISSGDKSAVKISDLIGTVTDTSGVNEYAAFETDVLPSRYYSLVLTAISTTETSSFGWQISIENDYESRDDWRIGAIHLESEDGFNWSLAERFRVQYAIYATPIPTMSITAMDEQIELRWEGFEGVTYQLQSRASLTGGEWIDLGEPLTGDGSELTVSVPVAQGESQSYYRVEVTPAESASE